MVASDESSLSTGYLVVCCFFPGILACLMGVSAMHSPTMTSGITAKSCQSKSSVAESESVLPGWRVRNARAHHKVWDCCLSTSKASTSETEDVLHVCSPFFIVQYHLKSPLGCTFDPPCPPLHSLWPLPERPCDTHSPATGFCHDRRGQVAPASHCVTSVKRMCDFAGAGKTTLMDVLACRKTGARFPL